MTTNICENWTDWLKKTRFSYMTETQVEQTLQWLILVRNVILERAEIKPDDTIIDIGCGTGLLGFGAIELISDNGLVIFSDKFQDCLDSCKDFAENNSINKNYKMLLSPCEKIELPDNYVDKALMRSVLVHIIDKQPAINEIFRILKQGGIFSCFEPIIRTNTHYWELTKSEDISDYEDFKNAEFELMNDSNNPLVNFDDKTLYQMCQNAGFSKIDNDVQVAKSVYTVTENMVNNWRSEEHTSELQSRI